MSTVCYPNEAAKSLRRSYTVYLFKTIGDIFKGNTNVPFIKPFTERERGVRLPLHCYTLSGKTNLKMKII